MTFLAAKPSFVARGSCSSSWRLPARHAALRRDGFALGPALRKARLIQGHACGPSGGPERNARV